jgi:hypothetical protein
MLGKAESQVNAGAAGDSPSVAIIQDGNISIGVFPEGVKALTAESPCV